MSWRRSRRNYSRGTALSAEAAEDTADGVTSTSTNSWVFPWSVPPPRCGPLPTLGAIEERKYFLRTCWLRIAIYAYERKRLNILTSALGELLKVFKRRRGSKALEVREGRWKTPKSTLPLFLFNWQRFSIHLLKVKSMGQLSGGLLSYLQRLGNRG